MTSLLVPDRERAQPADVKREKESRTSPLVVRTQEAKHRLCQIVQVQISAKS
jgi:hypothetical protein